MIIIILQRKSKRALNNWKKLIKGLLLREKVRRKFCLDREKTEQSASSTTLLQSDPTYANDLVESTSLAWPQCRMEFTMNDTIGNNSHL